MNTGSHIPQQFPVTGNLRGKSGETPFESRFRSVVGLIAVTCVVLLPVAYAESDNSTDRSPFIDSIAIGSTWQDVAANEGNNLNVDFQTIAFSGGGTANGRTVIFGGGHNNGLSDAVAFLDWRNFETVGWTEDLMSTADFIGVNDNDWRELGEYLNANYNTATPGGIFDGRGQVALSRHTYDQIVVRSDHFYMFAGILGYDNPGQPATPWDIEEGDIWRYDFGSGWTFIGAPLARYFSRQGGVAEDTLTGNIWVHDADGLRLFDTTTETTAPAGDYLNSQAIESFLNFNPDKGAEGTLFGGGGYAGQNWHEYDIATGQQRNMGAIPGNNFTTYMIYVDASYGADYGTYFAIVPQDGTLKRWNGSGWDTIATGGPGDDYVYGRGGFEPVHQVFFWIHNPYTDNNSWQTRVVRPFAFNGSVEPAPIVTLSANPDNILAQGVSTLTWSSTNADSCSASGNWSGAKPVAGSEEIGPLVASSSYSLTCSGNGGTSAGTATVTVQTAQPAPVVNLSANPDTVDEGGSTVIDWTTVNADTCLALGDWSGSKPTQGSESIGPISSESQFRLSCTGVGGEVIGLVNVTVNAAPTPPPPPAPPPPARPPDDEQSSSGAFGFPMLLLMLAIGVVRLRSIRR